jgi:phage gpG-like protein
MGNAFSLSFRDTLSPALRAKLDALRDTRPILEAGGFMLKQCALQAWRDAAMRPVPWQPLKPATVERKEKAGKTAMLIFERHMQQSLRVGVPSSGKVEVGSDAFYAPFHQFGTKRMPARPFIPMHEDGKLVPAAEARVYAAMKARLNQLLK